jgi:hypothetical protein|tara:strand:+ start:964 stop:1332 length:369 start_codon:yes stop_codon:yes gene_type:complete
MTEETLDAAILTLRAKALEVYGLMKETYARNAEPGDVELLSQYALKLAQLEGAMITLQQYRSSIIDSAKEKRGTLKEPDTVEEEIEEPKVISESELAVRSDSFKRSIEYSTPPIRTREIDES